MISSVVAPTMALITVHAGPSEWVEPTAPYGGLRLHDWNGRHAQWEVEREAPGVFDTADLAWLAAHAVKTGTVVLGGLYGSTAPFYATDKVTDMYGRPGAASAPADLGTRARFAEVYVSAFNRPSAANPTGKRLMPIVEDLNEPHGFFNPTTPPRGDWALAARMCRYGRLGAKAADSGILYAGPSLFAEVPGQIHAFLTAPDGIGGRGTDHIDALNIHDYNQYSMTAGLADLLDMAEAECKEAGAPGLPIVLSESGINTADPAATPWMKLGPEEQAREWVKSTLYAASRGVIARNRYAWDGYGGPIFAMGDKPAFAAAMRTIGGFAGRAVQRFDPDDTRAKVSGKWVAL